MQSAQLPCILLLLFASRIVLATEAPDTEIRNAMADLLRYQQQTSALTTERASHVRRVLRLVNLSHERLQQSAHPEHETWRKTDADYRALLERLQALLEPSGSASQQPPAAQSPATSGTGQAAAPGSQPSSLTADSPVQPLVSGQRVQLKKLLGDITAVRESLVTTGPSALQDGSVVGSLKKRFDQFSQAIGRYPQLGDPDVIAARDAYDKLRLALRSEHTRAQEQLASLGDVQTRLSELQQVLQSYPVPSALDIPFDKSTAEGWISQAGNSRAAAEHAMTQLAEIASNAYLPATRGLPSEGAPYDADDVNGMMNQAQGMLRAVQATYGSMIEVLESRFQQIESELSTRWQENPNSDKRYLYLDQERQSEAFAVFDNAESTANSFIALESALQRDFSAGDELLAMVAAAKAHFQENVDIALATSRMPEAASTETSMLAIAEKIVAEPSYEFGEAGDIVLTTDSIVSRERKDSDVEFDDVDVSASGEIKLSGTETTWTYRWDEFKFAVPLKDPSSGHWHIWWITAKNFSSGGARTPIGKWISGSAKQGNRIMEENI